MLKESKSEILFRQLQEKLVAMSSGDLFPSVRQLMKEYGVSQLVVKEALDKLTEHGLIDSRVGKGTFVKVEGRQRPLRILFYFPDWPGYPQDIDIELREEARRRGYNFKKIIYDVNDDFYDRLAWAEADAILINPIRGDLSPEQLKILLQAPIPVVMVKSTLGGTGLNYICGNNTIAGMMAANYLIDLGHTELAFIQSEPVNKTFNELYDGFCHVAESRNAGVVRIDCDIHYGELSPVKTHDALCRYLQSQPVDFSAAFVLSDISALGVLKAFSDRGIKVPQQVGVLGFGGDQSAALYSPPLSSVAISRTEIARGAFELIDRCFASRCYLDHCITVYPQIVERESIGKKFSVSQ